MLQLKIAPFFLFVCILSFGQKNVLRFYDPNGNPISRDEATYFTVKNKINDSCWSLWYYRANGPVRKTEQFRDKECTIKQGECAYYDKFGIMDSTGHIFNGQQEGKWMFFSETGDRIQEKIYQSGLLLQVTNIPQQKNGKPSDSNLQQGNPNDIVPAEFSTGKIGWQKYLLSNLRMPVEFMNSFTHLNAQIVVGFIVDTDGRIYDIEVVKSALYSLDNVAIELIRKSPAWIPASQNGVKVKYFCQQPVIFRTN